MVTSARDIMNGSEFDVELPTLGHVIKCRKIGNLELVLQGAEGIMGFAEEENGKKPIKDRFKDMTREEKEQFAKDEYETSRLVVITSAISPRITNGDWSEVDRDEEIHVSTLDADLQFLALTILHKSGMLEDMPELPFRGKPGRTDSTSDGGELRETADGTSKSPSKRAKSQSQGVPGGGKGKGKGTGTNG